MDLSIIIVSFNTKQLLKNCIESIRKNTKDLQYEIIVVDNASIDGTSEEISNLKSLASGQISNFKYIQNKENVGFAKANNTGIKHAKGKYILFLNSDTKVKERTLGKMVQFMDDHPETGVSTCKVELPNGEIDDACHRGFPTPWNSFCYFSKLTQIFPKSRIFAEYTLGYKNLSVPHQIDACAGAFMMVRKDAGNEIGWWDEDYFWYGEDLDFCYRVKKKGWKIMFYPDVSILHYKGASGGIKKTSQDLTSATAETKKLATKARFEAMRIFYKKHYVENHNPFLNWLVFKGINFYEHIAQRFV